MPTSPGRFAVAALSALAVVAGFSALPAEAKTPPFKPSFTAKLPGEPKGATTFKATVKGPFAPATGYVYTDATGQLHAVGSFHKIAGFTSTDVTFDVLVAAGLDLTNVTFPVTAPALVTYNWNKTTVNPRHPSSSKIISYLYSSDVTQNTTVTITSYDPVKNELKGTVAGDVSYHENLQDPNDDARDGKVVTLKNTKFALKPVGQ